MNRVGPGEGERKAGIPYVLSAVCGAALWLATSALTGRREAWDSSGYWSAAYPLGIVVVALIAYYVPDRAWRWGLSLMLAQAVTLAVSTGEFGLLPLGLVMFGLLSLPPIAVAVLASRAGLRRRR